MVVVLKEAINLTFGFLVQMRMKKDDDDNAGDDDADDDDDDAGDCERIPLRILWKAWHRLLVAVKDKH